MLPIKTTIEDVDALGGYLKTQVGWVPIDRVKKTIDSKYADNRKLEALKRIGLLERDGTNIKLSERGRAYADATEAEVKQPLMIAALREVPLYVETIEWMHHSKIQDPSKTVIGNYWHDKHQDQLEGAQGAALTDAVIFFMRVAGDAGLGKFTRGAKAKPDSYFKTDSSAIEAFVTARQGKSPQEGTEHNDSAKHPQNPPTSDSEPEGNQRQISVETSPAVHVNLEIHIAADATAETVAEIFKNMRKYVLSNPADAPESV
ncbi:hypothetical protein SAMN04489765_2815 [Tsukamurella pulmonis]|uniref:DUF5343 domain-containing protein n=1 Tax=Tsukamurella pulmonis TaxID=47312 RepID=A0A1H1FNB8_9ACTN|nr:hypothetical protein [Tsukamurella pulmonis]SDR02400.1 hypothetical protein SAMN04489765_2815 [Tsukamurella pulmonis]SUP18705.1 Uncharacterised protein [Tsukamurella pulmonis]